MKLLTKFILINLSYAIVFDSIADTAPPPAPGFTYNYAYDQQTSQNTSNTAQYLLNLGSYLGFDLTKQASATPAAMNLINVSATQLAQGYLYNSFLGAIPVNAISQSFSSFLPNSVPTSQALNPFANLTFSNPPYNSASSQQSGSITVNALIDQQPFQQDPVSQGVLNILATPDYSYCMNYDGSAWVDNCQLLYQNKVMANVIGTIPNALQFFDFTGATPNNPNNPQIVGQLNINSLLAPLMYSSDNPSANTTSSGTPSSQVPGLTAQNQMQTAANFIRYASGMVVPTSLPQLKNYDSLYQKATSTDPKTPVMVKMQAQATLANYFATLRVYAAQTSVGLSNLYYILSKRMPQNLSQGSSPTSQALSEYNMATWRITNPGSQSQNNQWINQINSASAETVQKEIAVLLAEINYQLYLNRQQEERILLTNSLMLIQNTKASQPSANFESNKGQ